MQNLHTFVLDNDPIVKNWNGIYLYELQKESYELEEKYHEVYYNNPETGDKQLKGALTHLYKKITKEFKGEVAICV